MVKLRDNLSLTIRSGAGLLTTISKPLVVFVASILCSLCHADIEAMCKQMLKRLLVGEATDVRGLPGPSKPLSNARRIEVNGHTYVFKFEPGWRRGVAASRIDEALEQNRVPMAVSAKVDGIEGIASKWIDGKDLDALGWLGGTSVSSHPDVIRAVSEARIFDFLIGQFDGRYGDDGQFHNLFAQMAPDGMVKKVYFIDHELAFSTDFDEKLESDILDRAPPVPPNHHTIERLREIDASAWRALLSDLLSGSELEIFLKRRNLLLKKYPPPKP